MGRINTGGAKKRTGDNIALASSVSGTTLKLNPPKGYYDGVTGTVNITDADFVAGKILSGTNLFGINGTAIDGAGKRSFATGTVYISGGASQNITTGLSSIDWGGAYIIGSTSGALLDAGNSGLIAGGVTGISVSGGTLTINYTAGATFNWFAVGTS